MSLTTDIIIWRWCRSLLLPFGLTVTFGRDWR